jgi:hypothetical protein
VFVIPGFSTLLIKVTEQLGGTRISQHVSVSARSTGNLSREDSLQGIFLFTGRNDPKLY